MKMPVAADVFGLLPAPPIPQVGATDTRVPDGLIRVIRALEEQLSETKTTDTSNGTADKSTHAPSNEL
jgi:hypothetical protein